MNYLFLLQLPQIQPMQERHASDHSHITAQIGHELQTLIEQFLPSHHDVGRKVEVMPAPFPSGFRFHIGRAEVEVKGRTRWDVCAIFGLILIPTRDGVSRPGLLLHEDDLLVGDLVLQLEARPVLEAVHLVAELAGVVEEHPDLFVVVAKKEGMYE